MSDLESKADWVRRVLGIQLESVNERSESARRALEAKQANPRGIAFPKLLLRWRAAQETLSASLDEISKAVLSHKDVIADPRYERVKACVAKLPTLVPTFGGQLENAIDAAINEGRGPRAKQLAAETVKIVDAYRQQVAAANQLRQLEAFAANDLAKNIALGSELDAALAEIRAELSSAP